MQPQTHSSVLLDAVAPKLGVLASRARVWGALSIAFGALGVLGAATMLSSSHRTLTEIATACAVAAFAAVGLSAGSSYLVAGRRLRELGRSNGDPIDATVASFARLGNAFRIEAIVTGLSIALAFAAGLVLGALRSV